MNSIFEDAKAFDQDVESWPNWEGKDLEEVLDTDSASEDEEDSEEDISGEEEQGLSGQSDGD